MKVIRLMPSLWLKPMNGTLTHKLSDWQEEVLFWRKEAASLRVLIHKGAAHSMAMDQEFLGQLERELVIFSNKLIPALEYALNSLQHLECKKKRIMYRYHEVEEQITRTRKFYQDLKMKLLPFLTKFIAIKIW